MNIPQAWIEWVRRVVLRELPEDAPIGLREIIERYCANDTNPDTDSVDGVSSQQGPM